MTGWEITAAGLVPALAVPVLAALRGRAGNRLAAIQLASSVSTVLLVIMTFAFDQSSFIDLALAVPLLVLPGTLVYTLFLERWI